MRCYILVLFAVILLISCDNENPAPVSIVGKWNVFGYKQAIEIGGKPAYDYFIEQGMTQAEAKELLEEIEEDADVEIGSGFFEFKSDGVWNGVFYDDEDDDSGDMAVGTWKLSDDQKTLTIIDTTFPDDPYTMEIPVARLTADELQIELIIEDEEDDFEDIFRYIITITFKRAS